MEHKQTKEHLRYLQSLPLGMKIRLAQQRVHEWVREFGENGVYVSFSGGKDSTVLLDIVRSLYPSVPAVFVDTGLEYPEIRAFVKTIENVVWLKPEMTFNLVLETYGYPVISKECSGKVYDARRGSKLAARYFDGSLIYNGKPSSYSLERYAYLLDAPFPISNKCCDVMKKKPCKKYEKQAGRLPIIATMTCESRLREQQWLQHGCNAFEEDRPRSAPMSFWTEQDVLRYIHTHNLRYARAIYGDIVCDCDDPEQLRLEETAEALPLKTTGASRTGCMFCMFGVQCESHPNRFERMKKTHPQLWDYCINKLGCGAVMDYIGVSYGKDSKDEKS